MRNWTKFFNESNDPKSPWGRFEKRNKTSLFDVSSGQEIGELKLKAAGLEISGETEAKEVTKAPGDALGHLEQAVHGFEGGTSQADVEIRPERRGSVP
jgi:hypothetical protein